MSLSKAKLYTPQPKTFTRRFWSAYLTPWAPGNLWRYTLGLTVFVALPFIGVGAVLFWMSEKPIPWVFLFNPIGFAFAPISLVVAFVGIYFIFTKQMNEIRARVAGGDAELWADGLIVANRLQLPGIIAYRDRKILLYFLSGRCEEIDPESMPVLRETRWFNGKYIGTSRCFWFKTPGNKRLGFAVADPEVWRDLIKSGSSASLRCDDEYRFIS